MRESWEINWEDYYRILGVSPDATDKDIEDAWRYKIHILHPDHLTGKPESVRRRAEEELKRVNNAHDVLKVPQKRTVYHEEWLRRSAGSANSSSSSKANPDADPPKPPPPPKSDSPPPPKPKPVANPSHIRFDNVQPNETKTSSFTVENAGGPYKKLDFSRPNSWLKIVRWSALSASDELPMRFEVEGVGTDWNRTYTESIGVTLDEEETTVKVELVTMPFTNNKADSVPSSVGTRGNRRSGTSRPWVRDLAFILAIVAIIASVIVVVHISKKPTPTGVPSDQTGNSTPAATSAPIEYGQTVTGSIAKPGDFQAWEFTGTAGDIVTIHATQDGGASLHPGLELFDTAGTSVARGGSSSEYSDYYIKNYKLGYSGVYAIRVYGSSSSTGGYKLSLAPKAPPASIAYGQEGAGHIGFAGDYEDWKFTGTAGDTITIHTIQDGGASLNPLVTLLDPSNTSVAEGKSPDGMVGSSEYYIKNYQLRFSGVHTIRVHSWDSGSIAGGYELSLALKAPPASIAYGQEGTGHIGFAGDYEDWKFTGTAGDTITIHTIQDGGASLNPLVTLLDPSNTSVAEGKSSDGMVDSSEYYIKNYQLRFSGVYTIRVHSWDSGSIAGGYKLSLALIP